MHLPHDDTLAKAVVSAIHNGDVERLKHLLRENPELHSARIVDKRGGRRTLLHVAADWPGHFPNGVRTVAILIAAGADANAVFEHAKAGPSAETSLHWAASGDDVAVLDALLDAGADIEAPGAVFTGGTPMSDAVVFAQWRAAYRLLERGGRTTIWQASALGLLDRVKECWDQDPPSDEQITNSFWHACRGGKLQTAVFFAERGANLNWIGYDRKTPLDVARESGALELVEWLGGKVGG